MEDFDRLVTISDPLLVCCLCRQLLQEAVQLTCLHCCCRLCFSAAASKDSSQCVCCSICETVTQAGCEQPNGFIDRQLARYRSIADSKVCGLCKRNGKHDKQALVWCSACQHSLCGDCIAAHRKCFRQHLTQSLEELGSINEVCLMTSATACCAIHQKPRDIACVSCEKVMCIRCWAECKKGNHEAHIVGDEAFANYVGIFISNISAMESELLLKYEVLRKPASSLQDAKSARDCHLRELNERKRCIVDAIEMVYQQIEVSTKNAYDDIERDSELKVALADKINSALSDARSYVRRLVESNDHCEILNQQKSVQARLKALSTELDSLRYRLDTTAREVKFEAPLPENLEDLVRAWVGIPVICSPSSSSPAQTQVQKQQRFSFHTDLVSLQLTVNCRDVALTKDGRSLLLAVQKQGLLEFSSMCGHQLSSWRPPMYQRATSWSSNGSQAVMDTDSVVAVSALSDGRAAVSLHYTRRIVLVIRGRKVSSSSSIAAATGAAWTEQLRFEPLPWPAYMLSAHGDLLAASQFIRGTKLQLLSLSSGRRWSDHVLQRDYVIGCLAVVADLVVTGSYDKVELGGSRQASYVLDAHTFSDGGSDERLWRHVLSFSDEQELCGVCADSASDCLYAAVYRSYNSSMVHVLSLRDGSDLKHVALDFRHSAERLWRLSMSDFGAAKEQQPPSSGSSSRVVLLAALRGLQPWSCRAVTVHHGCLHTTA